MKYSNWILAMFLACSLSPAYADDDNQDGSQKEEGTTVTTDSSQTANQPPVTQGDRTFTAVGVPLDMPYVPQYSGQKKFMRSRKIVNNKTGDTGLECSWIVKENSGMVQDWYRSALKQMQWQGDNNKNPESVVFFRLKDGYKVMINCHPGPTKEYPTVLVVSFSSFKPVDGTSESDEKSNKPKGPVTNSKPQQPAGQR